MFVARFVWGLGSAGPRVAVMAMVRDAYSGEQMAKQMSFIMAVFILVPTFAPSLSALLLLIGPWQLVFWLCAAAGVPCVVIAGEIAEAAEIRGVTATFSICMGPMQLADALRDAAPLTARAAANVVRLFKHRRME